MTKRDELIARVEADIAACNGPTTKWTHTPVRTADLRALIALASPVVDEAAPQRTPLTEPVDGCWYPVDQCTLPHCDCNERSAAVLAAFPQAETNPKGGDAPSPTIPPQYEAAPGDTLPGVENNSSAVIAAYIAGATDVHNAWIGGYADRLADFTEAGHDYAAAALKPWEPK